MCERSESNNIMQGRNRTLRSLSQWLVNRIRKGYSVDLGEELEADSRFADVEMADASRIDRPVGMTQAACGYDSGHCPTDAATGPSERPE